MAQKNIFTRLRTEHRLSQDEMAERLFVTRQAVSRWECGEMTPNIETLKMISKEFDVSINTLLGSPRKPVCQSCGMPLEDDGIIGREADGSMNEEYCKWCYEGGAFKNDCTMEEMVEECIPHMNWPDENACRDYLRTQLALLNRWKKDGAQS